MVPTGGRCWRQTLINAINEIKCKVVEGIMVKFHQRDGTVITLRKLYVHKVKYSQSTIQQMDPTYQVVRQLREVNNTIY